MIININGHLSEAGPAALPHDNRAFRYGTGLFETILCVNGQLQLADYHWERLFAGMKQLHFQAPALFTPSLLEREVSRTIQRNRPGRLCRVRLQVWPGNGGLYDEPGPLGYIIECFPLQEEAIRLNDNGLVVGLLKGAHKSCDALSGLKSCNALIYSYAARQARENHWNDALIPNEHGRIAESTIANIFWVKDARIYTPPLTEGCVNGVMRRHISQSPALRDYPVEERYLTRESLLDADEIFLTNAIRKIKWVRDFEGKKYKPELSRTISALL